MDDDVLIDNYFKGLLSEDEKAAFLKRLASDISFNEKFMLEKQLLKALDDEAWSFAKGTSHEVNSYKKLLEEDDLQRLKKTLANTNTEFNTKETSRNKRLYYYLAAASIVILLAFQFFSNQNISNQDLYYDYMNLNDLPSFTTRGDESNDLVKAQNLFENEKYQEALTIFQSIDGSPENKANLALYTGISQTELGEYDDAEQTFNSLINSGLLDAEKGNWYKALLFLKQNRLKDTKKVLSTIVSDDLFNSDSAKALLKALN